MEKGSVCDVYVRRVLFAAAIEAVVQPRNQADVFTGKCSDTRRFHFLGQSSFGFDFTKQLEFPV
jgi:hypothetical protein